MNKLSLVKYKHGNENGLMHYVIFESEVVVLSEYKSKKVTHIEENGTVNVTFDIKSDNLEVLNASVVTDKAYVERVYNYMLEINNAYFTDGFETLCVIKIFKK